MVQQSLSKKINQILFIVAFGVFLITSLLTGIIEYRKIQEEYSTAMQARINVAQTLMENTLFHIDDMVLPFTQEYQNNLNGLFAKLATSRYFEFHGDSFYVLDPKGKVFLISKLYSEYLGLDFSAMICAESGHVRQVNHHYQSLLSQKSVVTIQYPLAEGYLLVVERNLESITSIMESFEQGKLYAGEMFFVLSTTGQVIYHPDHFLMTTRHNLGFDMKEFTTPVDSGLFSFKYQNSPFISLREQFTEPADWLIYYSVPKAIMIGAIQTAIFKQLSFLLVLFLLLFITLRLAFNKFFTKPVHTIVEGLQQSHQDNKELLSLEIPGNILEFKTIIAAINTQNEKLANTTQRFQTVLNSLDAIVYVADMETYELLFLNSYGQKLLGDCVGARCYQFLQQNQDRPCEFCTNHLLVDKQGAATDVHVWEFQNTVTQQWYECRDQAIYWTDGRLVRMEIATDITTRKNAEQALEEEKERLNVTLRSIGDGVITTDIKGKIVLVNKVTEKLTGWSQQDAVGRPVMDIFNIINEKTGEPCENPVDKVFATNEIVSLANHTALIARDGTHHIIEDSGAPIYDKQSELIGSVLVFRDVTEKRNIAQEFLKFKKLESVGLLAGGIAHDFNNILAAILGNIELATLSIDTSNSAYTLLQEAKKASLRAKDLTQQLLTFSKGGDPVKKTSSIAKTITDSANFVLHGSTVLCQFNIPEDLYLVDIDAGQISQVIQNLVINAKQAMPGGGVIKINCSNIADINSETSLYLPGKAYIKIAVQDEGCGITGKYLEKIFDPYFTTKQEGSGLGLATSYSIISKHNGLITVDSSMGRGTTFSIYLPSADKNIPPAPATPSHEQDTHRANILIMDDDLLIQEMAKQMLQYLGHDVLQANNGNETIAIFTNQRKNKKPVDIIIMDLTIPGGMGGKEAIKEILKIDPDANVIVASGYSNDPVMANCTEYGFKAAIAKPFLMSDLQQAINSILKY